MTRKLLEGTSSAQIISGLVSYVYDDGKSNPAYPLMTYNMSCNGQDITKVIRAFEKNYEYSRKRKGMIVLYHEIMSFHENDSNVLNPQTVKYLTRQYMRLRGANGLCFSNVHIDQKHLHIHILVSGNKVCSPFQNRMTKRDFQSVQEHLQELQLAKFPEIKYSEVLFSHQSEQNLNLVFKKNKSQAREKLLQWERRIGKDIPSKQALVRGIMLEGIRKSPDVQYLQEWLSEQGLELTQVDHTWKVGYFGKFYRVEETLELGEEFQELVGISEDHFDLVSKTKSIKVLKEIGIEKKNDFYDIDL